MSVCAGIFETPSQNLWQLWADRVQVTGGLNPQRGLVRPYANRETTVRFGDDRVGGAFDRRVAQRRLGDTIDDLARNSGRRLGCGGRRREQQRAVGL